jgi:hypothetical protein
MTRTIVVSTVAIALLGSAAMLAQAQQQQPQMNPQLASFFIAENPSGTGNIGGLAGADQICQNEAQALGGQAATRTWHAYLSQEQRGTQPRINARDRIGTGPWYNVKGQLIASIPQTWPVLRRSTQRRSLIRFFVRSRESKETY